MATRACQANNRGKWAGNGDVIAFANISCADHSARGNVYLTGIVFDHFCWARIYNGSGEIFAGA